MIFHDLQCYRCDELWEDFDTAQVPPRMRHLTCGGVVEIVYRPKSQRPAQWSDQDAVVVFRDPSTGQFSIPPRNDAPTPHNMERVEMRSLPEVQLFEKKHGYRSEMVQFDPGTGRGFATGHPDYPID